jgi:hypothetical protein
MKAPPHPDDAPGRPGADDEAWGPSVGFLAIALGLVAGALAWEWTKGEPPRSTEDGPVPASGPVAAPPATAAVAPTAGARARVAAAPVTSAPAPRGRTASAGEQPTPVVPPHVVRRRNPNGDQTPDLSDYVNDGDIPTTAEVIDRLHQAGIQGGLGAFSPPGTRPPLIGLAVPEGFELPPGYVRHYQATDDGQRIEPILMFSPDTPVLDANGQPIAIPKDRVVPPELAPPGLPIRRIVVPAPIDSSRPGS